MCRIERGQCLSDESTDACGHRSVSGIDETEETANETDYRSYQPPAAARPGAVCRAAQHYPILANVVLQAEGGMLLMTATDMDMDIATQVECVVGTSGTTTVSAHLLYDIARKLPEGAEVEISVADGHA